MSQASGPVRCCCCCFLLFGRLHFTLSSRPAQKRLMSTRRLCHTHVHRIVYAHVIPERLSCLTVIEHPAAFDDFCCCCSWLSSKWRKINHFRLELLFNKCIQRIYLKMWLINEKRSELKTAPGSLVAHWTGTGAAKEEEWLDVFSFIIFFVFFWWFHCFAIVCRMVWHNSRDLTTNNSLI